MKRRTNPTKHAANSASLSIPTQQLQNLIRSEVNSQIRIQQITIESSYSGPLPQADEAIKFEEACPGFIHRWTIIAEKEQDARLSTVTRRDYMEFTYRLGGLLIAAIVCVGLLSGGIWLIKEGKSLEGFSFITVALAQIIVGAISHRKKTT
jgi:hypothetical protein